MTYWINLLSAGFTGGVFVKLIDIGYNFIISTKSKNNHKKKLIESSMDLLLKNTCEIVGKTITLAKSDFLLLL